MICNHDFVPPLETIACSPELEKAMRVRARSYGKMHAWKLQIEAAYEQSVKDRLLRNQREALPLTNPEE